MEDIYKIQVSVGLNESIFTRLKTLTAALNKADASVTRLVGSLKSLSSVMKATGLGTVEVVKNAGRMGTVFGEAAVRTRSLNASLSSTSRHLASVAKLAQDAGASVSRIGGIGGIGLGGAAVIGGMGAWSGIKDTIGAASDVQNKSLQLRLMNLPRNDYRAILDAVDVVTHTVAGTTISGVTELARDLTTVLGAGKTSEVVRLLPQFAQFQTTMQKVYGEVPKSMMIDAMRYLEHLPGALSHPSIFQGEMESLFKVRALGALVNPTQYFKAMQTGKTALSVTDDSFRYGAFASLLTGKTGFTLGTQVMSAYYALVGGHMQKGTAAWLNSLGLLEPLSKSGVAAQSLAEGGTDPAIRSRFASSGMGYAIHQQIRGLLLYLSNPYQWSKEYLVPAIMKEHGWKNVKGHRQQIAAEEGQYFWRNVSDFLGQMVIRQPAIERDIKLIQNLKGLTESSDMANKTFKGAVDNFSASVKNFAASMGKGALHPLSALLNTVSGFGPTGRGYGGPLTMRLPAAAGVSYMVNTGQISRDLAAAIREGLKGNEGTPITVQVVMDGKKVAETVSRHMVGRHTHPTGAASSNGAIFPATSGHGG